MEETIEALTGLAPIVMPFVMIIAVVWLGIRQSTAKHRTRVELQR